nr:MAG TPA: hypothetical protein [Caudoviricetes sp.]
MCYLWRHGNDLRRKRSAKDSLMQLLRVSQT